MEQQLLFTPGPLNTSMTTKEAMLVDWGSRDTRFIKIVKEIKNDILKIAKVSSETHAAVLLQGSGTYAVESVLGSGVPPKGKLVILANGSYGDRMAEIARYHQTETVLVREAEDRPLSLDCVRETLLKHGDAALVATVHGETSTGILNPVEEIGALVRQLAPKALYFVDAMSTFGGQPLDVTRAHIDFLVSSANKCLEGVPGFAFVVVPNDVLAKCKGQAHSLCLDLFAQHNAMTATGQFRFTPPTHSIVAFAQALKEFWEEGGVEMRHARYARLNGMVVKGMTEMGFKLLVEGGGRGCMITSFYYPKHPNFNFDDFYQRLTLKKCCIYPGKTSKAECFRLGNIGHLRDADIDTLLSAVRSTLADMGIPLPLQ